MRININTTEYLNTNMKYQEAAGTQVVVKSRIFFEDKVFYLKPSLFGLKPKLDFTINHQLQSWIEMATWLN